MSAYKSLFFSLIAALPLTTVTADELAPPDVDLFIEVQYGAAELDKLGMDTTGDGYRLRAGLWLNSLATPSLQFALEAGLSQLARENDDQRFTRGPTPEEQMLPNVPTSVDMATRDRLEVSGYEFGGRVLVREWVYARAGLFAHRVKTRHEEIRTLHYSSGPSTVVTPVPESGSRSRTGGYAGAGLLVPLTGGISLALDYSLYLVDSEQVATYAGGLHLRF